MKGQILLDGTIIGSSREKERKMGKRSGYKVFGIRDFLETWNEHQNKDWESFLDEMRAASGKPNYNEYQLWNRLTANAKKLKEAGFEAPNIPTRPPKDGFGTSIADVASYLKFKKAKKK